MGHCSLGQRTTPSVRFISIASRPYRPHSLRASNECGPFKGALDGGRPGAPRYEAGAGREGPGLLTQLGTPSRHGARSQSV